MNLVSSIFFVLAAVLDAHSLLDNLKCPPVAIPRGRVRLRSRGRIAKYSCIRGYQLLGEKYSTCLRGRWDTPPPVCISTGCPSLNNMQNAQVLESYRGALVKIQCDPGHKITGSSSLYCNGRSWNDTLPSCEEIKYSVPKWCDFESEDLCGWTHDQTHDFNWKRHNFATPSGHVGTGPAFDHTFGPGLDGHYMYLETSSPRLENDTARLVSPEYPSSKSNDSCFIFWYHMYGATTGSLQVYLHTHDTILLFSEHGDHGNHWIKGIIPLPFITTSFQIIIEGVRGPGYVGDTAIDDVTLADGEECSNSGQGVSESCQGRCYNSKVLSRSACECHQDCFTSATCCPDFVELCGIVSTQTTGIMRFSSNISSERMTVTPIPNFPLFSLSITTSPQSSVFTEKLIYHTQAVIAEENLPENSLIVEQNKNKNVSLFGIYNNKFEKQKIPFQKNTFSHENNNTLNGNSIYSSAFVPLNYTILPTLKNVTENYNGKVSTSFTLFSDPIPYYITNKTELGLKQIKSVIPTFTQPFASLHSIPTSKTVTEFVANTRQYIPETSTWKQIITKSFNQTLLPSVSVFPITVTGSISKPENSTISSPIAIKSMVNFSTTVNKFNALKIYTTKPILNYTRIFMYNNVYTRDYVNRLNKLRNMSRFLPVALNTPIPDVIHHNSTSDSNVSNKTVSSTVDVTNMTYKQLFPISLPKAKNDVLYPIWVKPAYGTKKSLQLSTSESKLTSAVVKSSLTNPKRNSYSTVPVILSTLPYKRTNETNKAFEHATQSKWISKYTSKGTAQKFSVQHSYKMIAGIGTVLGVLMLALIGSAVTVIIIRKHKINRRNNLDNGESDYLTSDEVLDLTWCGPAQPIQQECTIHDN